MLTMIKIIAVRYGYWTLISATSLFLIGCRTAQQDRAKDQAQAAPGPAVEVVPPASAPAERVPDTVSAAAGARRVAVDARQTADKLTAIAQKRTETAMLTGDPGDKDSAAKAAADAGAAATMANFLEAEAQKKENLAAAEPTQKTETVQSSLNKVANSIMHTNHTYENSWVWFEAGALQVNPYSISSGTNGTLQLQKRSSSTDAYIDFHIMQRWVAAKSSLVEKTKHGETPDLFAPWWGGESIRKTGAGVTGVAFPFSSWPDVDLSLGYVFRNSSGPSNYTATTVVGGGDFHGQVTFGFPFIRHISHRQAQQLSIETQGAIVADKSFLLVHPEAFVGLGYQISFPGMGTDTNSTPRVGFATARVGAGWADSPVFEDGSTLTVATDRTLPKFAFRPSLAMGMSVYYPITSGIYISVFGNAYVRQKPTPWTVGAAITIPLDKLSGFGK